VKHAEKRLLDDTVDFRHLEGGMILVALVALQTDIAVLEDAVDVLTVFDLGETLDKLAVDADGFNNNGGDVLSRGTSLVRTDSADIGYRLTGIDNTSEQAFLGHTLGDKRQSKSDGKRETFIERLAHRRRAEPIEHTFRDGNGDQGDGNNQDLYK
jgi:hypothetical protein